MPFGGAKILENTQIFLAEIFENTQIFLVEILENTQIFLVEILENTQFFSVCKGKSFKTPDKTLSFCPYRAQG